MYRFCKWLKRVLVSGVVLVPRQQSNKYHCAIVNNTWSASKTVARPNLTFCESKMPHKPLETHAPGCKLHQNFFWASYNGLAKKLKFESDFRIKVWTPPPCVSGSIVAYLLVSGRSARMIFAIFGTKSVGCHISWHFIILARNLVQNIGYHSCVNIVDGEIHFWWFPNVFRKNMPEKCVCLSFQCYFTCSCRKHWPLPAVQGAHETIATSGAVEGPEWLFYSYLILVRRGKLSWVLRDEGGYQNVNNVNIHATARFKLRIFISRW